jgi:ABC-type transporter Mla maintaining outer membrane lipid asymmetry ATPase subunit MlaF
MTWMSGDDEAAGKTALRLKRRPKFSEMKIAEAESAKLIAIRIRERFGDKYPSMLSGVMSVFRRRRPMLRLLRYAPLVIACPRRQLFLRR